MLQQSSTLILAKTHLQTSKFSLLVFDILVVTASGYETFVADLRQTPVPRHACDASRSSFWCCKSCMTEVAKIKGKKPPFCYNRESEKGQRCKRVRSKGSKEMV